eukprot:TRINITY_DN7845_c0_g1_i1.p1 TRINITY_DN7845_c0_g1~~TRINITY_DN7845_c0_g1_i1.p1  ORF type:complete len:416 (-),score=100.03 TRINITY_DN7845_c0_g1_i1:273-1520(-)
MCDSLSWALEGGHSWQICSGRRSRSVAAPQGTSKFEEFARAVEVHLVEVSPALRKQQKEALRCTESSSSSSRTDNHDSSSSADGPGRISSGNRPSTAQTSLPSVDSGEESGAASTEGHGENLRSGISGARVSWHLDLEEVPRGDPCIIIAHEFFDALPVHQFQKTKKGWHEKLVDCAADEGSSQAASSPGTRHLRFVLSPAATAASTLYLPRRLKWASQEEQAQARQVEVCPWGMRLAVEIAKRVGEDGGGALVIDYGEDRLIEDSLQAIRKHAFVHVLETPGAADLSAYVDFAALRHAVEDAQVDAAAFGPVNQNRLLWSLGINVRLEALLQNESPQQAEELEEGYMRLMGESDGEGEAITEDGGGAEGEQQGHEEGESSKSGSSAPKSPPGMGVRYKALAIVNKKLGAPAGFT